MRCRLLTTLLMLVAAIGFTGCGSNSSFSPPGAHGGIAFSVQWPATRVIPQGTVRIAITLLQDEVTVGSLTLERLPGQTSASGQITNIPAGLTVVNGVALDVDGAVLGSGSTTATVIPGRVVTAELTLGMGGSIFGHVLTAMEAPLPDTLVACFSGDTVVTTTTDAQGAYLLPNVSAGAHVVSFAHAGYATVSVTTVVAAAAAQVDVMMPTGTIVPEVAPVIQLNDPVVDQNSGMATISGTILNLDAPSAVLILNGAESLITVNADNTFSTLAILQPGANAAYVRAVNAIDSAISAVLTLTYTPVGGSFFRVTLSWDGAGDVDLHTWDPNSNHSYFSAETIPTGTLDVDNTSSLGPENFTCTSLVDGRFCIAVNNYGGAEYRQAIIRVTINSGPNTGRQLTFGPYSFSTAGETYPVTTDSTNWWRPCDILVSGQTISVVPPDTTITLGNALVAARRKAK